MHTKSPRAMISIPEMLLLFKQLLPAEVLAKLLQQTGRSFYQRLFTPLIVLWCFLFQRLNVDHTLDAVVSYVSRGGVDHLEGRHVLPVSQRLGSQSTAAYSQARKRLPLSLIQGVAGRFAQVAEQCVDSADRWRGYAVVMIDGTTFAMRPEEELVAHYGQTHNQHDYAYWVTMRSVAAFSLSTGAILGLAEGPHLHSEQVLTKPVLAQLPAHSLCVGDSNFGVFSVAQAARHYQMEVLLRLTRCRARALAKGGGKWRWGESRCLLWAHSENDQVDPDMSADPIPGRLLFVCLERDGFRPLELFLFTTLQDEGLYPLEELVQLYGRRWQAELNLLYVKSTLDMDLLEAKSVEMIRKELWAGAASYNLVRVCAARAVQGSDLHPLDLSFTQCWRRVQEFFRWGQAKGTPEMPEQQLLQLLEGLTQCLRQQREPLRLEPRAVRRRPRKYSILNIPRELARQRTLEKRRKGIKC